MACYKNNKGKVKERKERRGLYKTKNETKNKRKQHEGRIVGGEDSIPTAVVTMDSTLVERSEQLVDD